ncbi:hypothetical protein CPAV1605_947 [seawater metagenome]|uniref:Endonuclease/Exonuclease/phosphatase family n=1 Tax=seawater metagenome TaxID=1561972 RepID=A0A5E8CM09_9ZZZZ
MIIEKVLFNEKYIIFSEEDKALLLPQSILNGDIFNRPKLQEIKDYNLANNSFINEKMIKNKINELKSHINQLGTFTRYLIGDGSKLKENYLKHIENNVKNSLIEKKENCIRLVSYNIHGFINPFYSIHGVTNPFYSIHGVTNPFYSKNNKINTLTEIVNLMNKLEPDIISLQEFCPISDKGIIKRNNFQDNLIENYWTISVPRQDNDDQTLDIIVSNAIISKTYFQFNKQSAIAYKIYDSKKQKIFCDILGYKFKFADQFNEEVIIFGIHPIPNWIAIKYNFKTINQLDLIFNTICKDYNPLKKNIIITGDFNTDEDINFLEKYNMHKLENKDIQMTCWNNKIIDHICISKSLYGKINITGFNVYYTQLSDHLPLIFDFNFKNI